ncbi:hypothetical protein Barb4_02877 [Bacteroidales bacterium Barb4]|nr:hypothetical protein Barb4_02877 [Bacteroidales bacterium Barb4]
MERIFNKKITGLNVCFYQFILNFVHLSTILFFGKKFRQFHRKKDVSQRKNGVHSLYPAFTVCFWCSQFVFGIYSL